MCDPCGFMNRLSYKAADKILNIQGEEVDLENLRPASDENTTLTNGGGPPSREEMARKLRIGFVVLGIINIIGMAISGGLGISKVNDPNARNQAAALICGPLFVIAAEIGIAAVAWWIASCCNKTE